MASDVIGRDTELAALEAFLGEQADGPRALILQGEPGIGKTALWEAAISMARERETLVLSSRPAQAEAELSFTALNDLLEDIDEETLGRLPAPQRRALEVALIRSEPGERPPEPRAIAAGFLQVIRELGGRQRLLVAIDDVQWLDAASSDALTFAARRLRNETVRFLVTTRPGGPPALLRALGDTAPARVEVEGLSFGAARRVLADRLGLVLPRRTMRRVFDITRGNPLFVLEVGRMHLEHGASAVQGEVPLPVMVDELLGVRVARLSGPVRRVLLAVALSPGLHESQLAAIVDPVAIDDARDADVLVVDGDHVRAAHPLLAEAARAQARGSERRALHLDLARVVTGEEIRGRHLALAATRPDESLAEAVAAAAAAANARGARGDAVELAGHALRLTPPSSAQRTSRLLEFAEYLYGAGEFTRLQNLLSPEIDLLPMGAVRARAHRLLIHGAASVREYDEHLERALSESQSEPAMRATVLVEKVVVNAIVHVARLDDAETWAVDALTLGRPSSAALQALGWVRMLRGQPIDDLIERERNDVAMPSLVLESMERLDGIRRAFRGEVNDARGTFSRLLALADERGEAWSYGALYLQLSELELRVGDCVASQRLLDEWDAPDELFVGTLALRARCLALLAAERGLPDATEYWTTKAMVAAETGGSRWDQLETLRARGIAALFSGQPDRAATDLLAVWDHTVREGVDDPGAFPVAPDLVEALAALGRMDEAMAVTSRLRRLSDAQVHPWGLATAERCGALVRLALDPSDSEAPQALLTAATAYGELGLRFDRGRSLLILGRSQRRARRWGHARESLEQALATFDEIGSTGWAAQARSELDRVGARRPVAAGTLTPAEARVVELAVEGHSNKEIAQSLASSVHTVEVQLSRAYAKLGVQSRAQLARRLATGPVQ